MLEVGQLVGNYRITRLLGEGGMGIVYHACHQLIGRQAAIKILRPELASSPEQVRRFLNEARAVNLVEHPGLVEIFEFGLLPDGTPHIVMEFLSGELLSERLCRGRDSLRMTTSLGVGIARAMAAAHGGGIVHRDLKPHNVFLISDGDDPEAVRIKVIDFGVAKLASLVSADSDAASEAESQGPRTRSGAVLGTPEYMAPEQCLGAGQATPKSDVYALGVMLYEMLAGRRPFVSDLPSEVMTLQVRGTATPLKDLVPDGPADLLALVHRMLSKRPLDRPTMLQVAERLQSLRDASEGPGAAVPTTLSDAAEPSAVAPRSVLSSGAARPLWPMLSIGLLVVAAPVAALKVWSRQEHPAVLPVPAVSTAAQGVEPPAGLSGSRPAQDTARLSQPAPSPASGNGDSAEGRAQHQPAPSASISALQSAPPRPAAEVPSLSSRQGPAPSLSSPTRRRSADLVVPLFRAKPPQAQPVK